MKNRLVIDGHETQFLFDSRTGLFRGEFTGLNSGADFYAKSIDGLIVEGRASLKVFLELCAENGIEPRKSDNPKRDNLRRDIAYGLVSGKSEPLDIDAIKRKARIAANM